MVRASFDLHKDASAPWLVVGSTQFILFLQCMHKDLVLSMVPSKENHTTRYPGSTVVLFSRLT